MRLRRPEPAPEPEPETLRDEFHGSDDCAHTWVERLEGPAYRGDRVQTNPYTLGERCLMCHRVWVAVLVTKEPLA
jgi:hypothetical protein